VDYQTKINAAGRVANPGHRHCFLPQSSSASRFTAGASGFFMRGGLIAYAVDQFDQYRQAASYVDRIL
jgi:hypothetical protein